MNKRARSAVSSIREGRPPFFKDDNRLTVTQKKAPGGAFDLDQLM